MQFDKLLQQLPLVAVLYDLGTAETEALTALVSTEMASPTQNSIPPMKALWNGWKDLPKTSDSELSHDVLIQAALQSSNEVRYAAVIRKGGKMRGIAVYLTR